MKTHQETTKEISIPVKRFDDFSFYRIETFYVISKHSTYRTACKQKTYKSYGAAHKVWMDILERRVTYVNF